MTEATLNKILEELSESIQEAESKFSVKDIADNIDLGFYENNDLDSIYKIAEYIIEPRLSDEIKDEYYNMVDSDDQWPQFIKNNFGEHWGVIAQFVEIYGY